VAPWWAGFWPSATAAGRSTPLTAEARELLAWFAGRSPSVMCRDITGCDLRTSAGSARMRDEDIRTKRCLPLVRDVVRHLARGGAGGGRA